MFLKSAREPANPTKSSKIFNVDVLSINTVKKAARSIRSPNRSLLQNSSYQKAIVKIKAGQTIEAFNSLKS